MYALYSFITDTCHVQSPCPLAKSHLIAVCTRNWKTGWRAPKVQPGLCAAVISSACFHSKWSHSDAEATYVKDRFDQHLPKGQRRRESKVAASEVASTAALEDVEEAGAPHCTCLFSGTLSQHNYLISLANGMRLCRLPRTCPGRIDLIHVRPWLGSWQLTNPDLDAHTMGCQWLHSF